MTARLMTGRLQLLASRGLAVGILLLLAGLIYTALIAPLLEDYAATRQQITQYTVLAERYQRLAEALPARRAMLASLKQSAAGEAGLITSANENSGRSGAAEPHQEHRRGGAGRAQEHAGPAGAA